MKLSSQCFIFCISHHVYDFVRSASSYAIIYRLLFGDSNHLHGDVFHTVPGKERKHKKKTQNQYSGVVGGFVVFIATNLLCSKLLCYYLGNRDLVNL